MIKIGVLSDTHIGQAMACSGFLDFLDREVFRETDIILHAGDLVDRELLHAFAPRIVHAVRGNMDPPSVALPLRKIVDVGGYRFGMMHGWGPPVGLASRILSEFAGDALDCLVYGHSHMPDCRRVNGVLLFNPGSATGPRGGFPSSVGLLEVDAEGIRGRILPIDED